MNMLVHFNRYPVTLNGEEDGDVTTRCKRQTNFDSVYGFKQTRENFDDRILLFEGVRKDGAQEFNSLR